MVVGAGIACDMVYRFAALSFSAAAGYCQSAIAHGSDAADCARAGGHPDCAASGPSGSGISGGCVR